MESTPKGRGFIIPYSQDYKEKCFAAWYGAGKPVIVSVVMSLFPKDEQGRTPSRIVVEQKWLPEWRQRADALDADSSNILDKNLIAARVQMLEEQAAAGKKLQKMGFDYFEEMNGIHDDSVALRAIVQGVEMERNSRGLAVALQRISSMSDDQLQSELNKQLARYKESSGDIVDGKIAEDDTVAEDDDA